jgi:hypothetical protein
MRKTNLATVAIIAVSAALARQSLEDHMPMNQSQVLGSHNSYKDSIDSALFNLLMKNDPRVTSALGYSHLSLTEQLDLGMRKLEIDVVYDPRGGLYARPRGFSMMK